MEQETKYMTEEQFIFEAKKLGYLENEIKEEIALHNEALEKGINIPYELFLVEKPLDNKK